MEGYKFALVVLLLFVINVDASRFSREHRLRKFWQTVSDKIKEKTVGQFHIDIRHFDREEMLLFPDVAFQSSDNDSTWKVMLHGWRYEGNRGKDWLGFSTSRWVERLAKHLLNQDAILYLNGSLNRDRLKPFFVEDESNELISVKMGDKTHSLYTDKRGQFYEQIEVSNDIIQKIKQEQKTTDAITYEAIGDNKDTATGIIRLIDPRRGVSVISDIDDTIKISEVLDKVRLLANTFIHPFIPVEGKYDIYIY